MESIQVILIGVSVFTTVVLGLVGVILAAKKQLIPEGDVKILINNQKEICGSPRRQTDGCAGQ